MKTIVNYAQKVKEQHALNKTLAPVETDLTSASKAYAVGQKFIHDGVLYQAKTAIAQGAALVLNTNYEAADDVSSEIEALTNQANDMVNVLGAKNLIPYPYHRQNGYTANGATFTYDDEGVITVNKVVGNSTAYFALFSNILYPDAEKFLEPNTSYILSMELENATDTSCFVQTQNGSDLAAIRNKTTGKYEISFTTTETVDSLAVALYYGAEKTENNAKVKLMIRLASINDSTYVPYAKTNRQLTAENQTLTNNLSDEVETRATLGTSNLDVPINEELNNATYSRSNNGYRVTSTVSNTWTNVCFYYKLPKNKDLKILTNVSHSAGTPRIAVYGNSIPSETGRTNITTKEISADGAVEVSFNTGNYEYIAVALFASINTAAQGDVTYADFIIKLSNDPNTSYTEPAMTNRELTESIVNSYIFKGTDTITITAEAADTWETMLEKSRVAINNYLANLEDNEYVRFIALSGAYSGISQIYDLKKKNDAFSGAFFLNGYTNSYATSVQTLIRIASSNKAAIRTTFSTSTGEVSIINYLSTSFGEGSKMIYLIDKFVKI